MPRDLRTPLVPTDPAPVTVHVSWRGVLSAVATPLTLVLLGGYALLADGAAPVPIGLVVLGVGLGAVTLWDYPRRAVFSADGVDRVCFLRVEHLPWDTLVAIERPRRSVLASVRLRGQDAPLRPPTGGLIARASGKRRYLLTDRIESRAEFDALTRLVDAVAPATVVRASRPASDVPPTDLYRRTRDRRGPGGPA